MRQSLIISAIVVLALLSLVVVRRNMRERLQIPPTNGNQTTNEAQSNQPTPTTTSGSNNANNSTTNKPPSSLLPSTYKPGDYKESITVDGRERMYLLHVPTKFDPDQRRSLVVVLHGTLGTGDKVEGQTGFSELAD